MVAEEVVVNFYNFLSQKYAIFKVSYKTGMEPEPEEIFSAPQNCCFDKPSITFCFLESWRKRTEHYRKILVFSSSTR
jgi:hypothetical protein